MRPMAMLLLLAALLSLFGLLPFPHHEISEMKPTELLCLQAAEGGVLVQTEEGLSAWGRDTKAALETLHSAASGELFLATVENLVLTETFADTQTLTAMGLRPGTAVYTANAVEDAKALNEYLKAHSAGVTLGMLQENETQSIPVLHKGLSGLYLEETE